MRRTALALLVALPAAGLVQACFSERVHGPIPETADCSVPIGAFGRDRRLVVIRDFTFLPDTVRIAPGVTVTWANCEPEGMEGHTVSSSTGLFSSPLLQAGGRFSQRFDATGTYEYTCGPHPHMRAVVVVE